MLFFPPSSTLKALGIKPSKKLGQNFLQDLSSLYQIEKYLSQKKLLEIGPGLGAITFYLLEKGFFILAIEKDKRLASFLEEKKREYQLSSLRVYPKDILEVSPQEIQSLGIEEVISNLPFSISSPFLLFLLKKMPFIKRALISLEEDFARRILQGRGSSLGVLLHLFYEVKKVREVSPKNFYPSPKGRIVWVLFKKKEVLPPFSPEEMERFLRACFWGRRKKLSKSLKENPYFSLLLPPSLEKKWGEKRADSLLPQEFQEFYLSLSQEIPSLKD